MLDIYIRRVKADASLVQSVNSPVVGASMFAEDARRVINKTHHIGFQASANVSPQPLV